MDIRLKRIYDPSSTDDGVRILVDRLWPRGMTRDQAGIDHWLREVAPSTELRKWYDHDESKWTEFKRRYLAELHANPEALQAIRDEAARGTVTLLFAARDTQRNNATALRELLVQLT